MTEEDVNEAPASEEAAVEAEGQNVHQDEPKMVPLSALEAERRKRQDLEAQNRLYADYMKRMDAETSEASVDDDEPVLVERKELKQEQAATKREIREEVFKDMNPKAMQEIELYLNKILEKKPWLTDSIKSSENRYARAAEIVEDYKHLVESKQPFKTGNEGARIVQNAQKPGSPVSVAKSAPTSNMAYLKSIQGTPQFREYRQKVMRGEL